MMGGLAGQDPSPPLEFATCLGDLFSISFLEDECGPSADQACLQLLLLSKILGTCWRYVTTLI